MIRPYLALLSIILMSAAVLPAQTVIVAENFGGTGNDLNGTTADTFDSAITTAGGSSTWAAQTAFKDDGSYEGGGAASAYLNLGSYINDSKGNPDAFFTVSVTISNPPSTGNYLGFGFFEANTPTTNQSFVEGGTEGMGITIYRSSGELDGFAGPENTNNVDGPDAQSGSQTLSIDLDLTDWNGTDNFGSITFYDGSGTSFGTHEYASTETWGSIGLTTGNATGASFSDFQLVQVPEPSSIVLFAVGAGLFLLTQMRRRT